MKYEYLTNVPLEQAKADYPAFLKKAGMTGRCETLSVTESLGRVTAAAVYARLCSPHYNASAMDGIALDARLSFGATETTPVILPEGSFIRLDTGDPLPEGCDAVVMIEDAVAVPEGIKLLSPAAPWQHIRQIGEDICAGDMILPSFTVISPAAMGAMLAGGVLSVQVMAKPLVGILPTGDELVAPSDCPKSGDVMEFNSAIFSGMLTQWGAQPVVFPIVRDQPALLRQAILNALEQCDCLLIGAGTSAGRDDCTSSILGELGEVLYHGIAIKPGKPAVLARVGAKPVLGVPGYPVSGIIVLEELFKPIVLELLKKTESPPEQVEALLGRRINSSLKYREFIRVQLSSGENGLTAVPLSKGAGVVTSFVKADGILNIPQNSEGCQVGDSVSVQLLRPLSAIKNSLSVIGSHDPLLDEAVDLLRRQNTAFSVSSSHVGSMGGIMALKRREAAMAGVHLLDPESGQYNISYVRRYFPDGDAVLVRCVDRVQGLMVAPGNPLNICGFSDISRLRYVNRQGGSGTRILCDHLIAQNGLDPKTINGYAREELTHTAVAAQIAAGTADAGLGIFSAAGLYGLSFIPICTEEYDLLMLRESLELPLVQQFLSIIRSDEFSRRLEALGGYELKAPGQLIEF